MFKDPWIEADGEPTPLGAAILETIHCRGYDWLTASTMLSDRFYSDMQCPCSAMFSPDKVVSHYRNRGHRINPVPLPRTLVAG